MSSLVTVTLSIKGDNVAYDESMEFLLSPDRVPEYDLPEAVKAHVDFMVEKFRLLCFKVIEPIGIDDKGNKVNGFTGQPIIVKDGAGRNTA